MVDLIRTCCDKFRNALQITRLPSKHWNVVTEIGAKNTVQLPVCVYVNENENQDYR